MTSITTQDHIPCISTQELKILSAAPGTLKVIVQKVSGYFVPFVHYNPPNEATQIRGIIVDGENVLATVDLTDIVTALEEILDVKDCIMTPDIPDGTTMH